MIRPLEEFDLSCTVDLFPELPVWVMNPDYERVSTELFT